MNKNAKTKKAVGNVFLFTVVLLYIFVSNEVAIPFLPRLEISSEFAKNTLTLHRKGSWVCFTTFTKRVFYMF